MRLAISLATRNRPQQVVDTIKRSIVNWSNPETIMYVQLDHDDLASCESIKRAGFGERVVIDVRERELTVADKWNRILMQVPDADVYMSAADDDPYIVHEYDTKILEASKRFPDGIGTVYGHMANLSFTGVSAPTKKLCDKLGYIFPPMFPYWWVDHHIDDVVRMIGRITFADVRTDQSHAGKTQEMREPAWWATFFDANYLVRRRQAFAIIDSPDFAGEPWYKELLKSNCHLIEQRSRLLNLSLRQDNRRLEEWSGLTVKDERYQRLKRKMLDMVPGLLADPEMHPGEVMAFKSILMPPTSIPSLKRAFG